MIDSLEALQESSERFLCVLCGRPTMLCCSSCRQVFYCSESHQLHHWKTHALECHAEDSSSETEHLLTPLEETVDLEQGPDNSLLANEVVYKQRKLVRSESIASMCDGNSAFAVSRLQAHFTKALAEYDRNRYYDIYDLLADGLLLAKSYMQNDELNIARQLLVTLAGRVAAHSATHNTHPAAAFRNDESKEVRASLTYAQLKQKLSVYCVLSNLLNACGDAATAEKMLVQYCKLVEVHLGLRSLEASNCCFMLGLFYIKRSFLKKALQCFTRASDIRREQLGETHDTVGDCLYNIGLIHRKLGNHFKANASLSKALEIRTINSSESSLQTAQVLEALGVFYMEQKDLKNAFEKLNFCYEIRKSLLKQTQDHAELNRIAEHLQILDDMVEEESNKDHYKRMILSKIRLVDAEAENHSPEKSAGPRHRDS